MSTKFIIPNRAIAIDEYGQLDEELHEEEYVVVARRSSGCRWVGDMKILHKHINPETKVYPLDNSPQGIYTIQDLINEIE
jgi:hypothetical protein